ncbi:MAG: HAMP domain-containing histidine kinase [Pirellulales bacterium]|nr:HAMP domain-containing histidine kinase [Pirellulales bacterium]
MMRPWQVWLAFVLCSAVLVAALCWLSLHAVRVARERSAARAEALLEQRVSLALWRMDTYLAPLIAEEIARPHFFYAPFLALHSTGEQAAGEAVPSPLLTSLPENVLLNFSCEASGQWTSPQCPPIEQRPLALQNGVSPAVIDASCARLAELASTVDVGALIAQLPAQPLPGWALATAATSQSAVPDVAAASASGGDAAAQAEQQVSAPPEASRPAFFDNYAASAPPPNGGSRDRRRQAEGATDPTERGASASAAEARQAAQGMTDLGQRSGRLQQAAQQEFAKLRGVNSYLVPDASPAAEPVIENVSRPLWAGDQLLLARRVERGNQVYVQGSWLDWPRLRQELQAEIADLLPQAELVPVKTPSGGQPTRMLAALPVELRLDKTAPGRSPSAQSSALDGPLQWALGFGWTALLAALAAVAALLGGVLALSERRAAFVSSVTHELRTPLTTFRMYADMLARDMVPSAARRQEYLETLKSEAERLSRLVENVLAYARLERGRRPRRDERTTPAAVIARSEPRLADRARQAGMKLECRVSADVADAVLLTDMGVVEQIIFNLVDNAAKYAARATTRQVDVLASREGKGVRFAVRDYGPGFASLGDASRLAPFSKSAQQAAESAPGVGLGLALCRRLAAELGGRLTLEKPPHGEAGACVSLTLPLEG